MSGICGSVGEADPGLADAMLAAIDYRGDRTDVARAPGVTLGYRWWSGRPGKSPGIHRAGPHLAAAAGTLAPPRAVAGGGAARAPGARRGGPRRARQRLRGRRVTRRAADSRAHPRSVRRPLALLRRARGRLLLRDRAEAAPGHPRPPVRVNPVTLHKYLTFSFVPGKDVPVLGIRRLLPGHVARRAGGRLAVEPSSRTSPCARRSTRGSERGEAVRLIRRQWREAIGRRLNGEAEVGLFFSGGIDSAGVGVWLREAGVRVRALGLDFGARSVERPQAETVAARLRFPLDKGGSRHKALLGPGGVKRRPPWARRAVLLRCYRFSVTASYDEFKGLEQSCLEDSLLARGFGGQPRITKKGRRVVKLAAMVDEDVASGLQQALRTP